MKFTLIAWLLLGGPVLAQDISSQWHESQSTNQAAATSIGTIDQPTASPASSFLSAPALTIQASATAPVDTPARPTEPGSPSLPSSPTVPLSPDLPIQPTAPRSYFLGQQDTVPTTPTPPQEVQTSPATGDKGPSIVLGNADSKGSMLATSTPWVASRAMESMENLSRTLNSLVKVKTD